MHTPPKHVFFVVKFYALRTSHFQRWIQSFSRGESEIKERKKICPFPLEKGRKSPEGGGQIF